MFVACGIWCLAEVSSVSPSSEQTVMWIRFFAADRNEFPARRLFCILKVARHIYLTEF